MAPIAAAIGLVPALFTLIDDLFTTEEERASAKLKVMELEAQGKFAQLDVNRTEASHASIFVAGWRPAIGWICGFSLAWSLILRDFLLIALATYVPEFDVSVLPDPDMGTVLMLLGGMLGLGTLRTVEKIKGVAGINSLPPRMSSGSSLGSSLGISPVSGRGMAPVRSPGDP